MRKSKSGTVKHQLRTGYKWSGVMTLWAIDPVLDIIVPTKRLILPPEAILVLAWPITSLVRQILWLPIITGAVATTLYGAVALPVAKVRDYRITTREAADLAVEKALPPTNPASSTVMLQKLSTTPTKVVVQDEPPMPHPSAARKFFVDVVKTAYPKDEFYNKKRDKELEEFWLMPRQH